MGVSLFTSRIVLQTLGITDYGINNVVGGVVAMFGFLSNSISAGMGRFFAFEIGKNNYDKLNKIFSLMIILFLFTAIISVIAAEKLGLWWVIHKLVIPPQRIEAAIWVFHCSVFCFFISLMLSPYISLIIAREKMSFFAKMSIVDVALKLLAVFLLAFLPHDKLKTLATFFCFTSVINFSIYYCYCRKNFPESKFKYCLEKSLFYDIAKYVGLMMTSSIAIILRDQGVNILMNMFYGPAINAARGIAYQINTAVSSFMGNTQTAIKPQIIKSYSSGNYEYMQNLVIRFTRIFYFIMLFLCVPIIFNIDFILKMWLGIVPQYSSEFTVIVLLTAASLCFTTPLTEIINATGKIKRKQIGYTFFILSVFPISYILCWNGFSPVIVLCPIFFIEIFIYIWGIFCLKRLLSFPFRKYAFEIFPKIFITTIITLTLPILLNLIFEKTVICSIILLLICFLWTAFIIFIVGLTKNERNIAIKQIKSKLHSWSKNGKSGQHNNSVI
ncbi:MAG: hypothetical protein LBH98_10350 [Chitinispirillales bacterium]|nr:hypothetical protein [Chitinispirillales bacterium]